MKKNWEKQTENKKLIKRNFYFYSLYTIFCTDKQANKRPSLHYYNDGKKDEVNEK